MRESKLFTFYSFLIFLLFVDSMYPWYMWENYVRQGTTLIGALVSIYIGRKEAYRFSITKSGIILCLFVFVSMVWNISGGDGSPISSVFKYLVIIFLILLRPVYRIALLSYITKWYASVLIFSLFSYISYIVGLYSINPSVIIFNDGQYVCNNFYTFIVSTKDFESAFRFMSIFMEPGHMTMGTVSLIMANRFDLSNRYVKMLVVCELFTFSLAGYITLFVGYVLFNATPSRLKNLFVGTAIVGLILFIISQTEYSVVLDQFIFQRLEFKDGDIAGNNRVSSNFQKVYDQFINSSDVWFGNSTIDVTAFGGISGYKKYLVQNGIVGLTLCLLVYTLQFFRYLKYDIGVFTLILLLLLYQNAYPYWFCMIGMYILGTDKLMYKKKRYIYGK